MYSAKFVSDNGKTFVLGTDGGNVFDIEGLSGNAVSIGTSQGFSQIGETVESQSVSGKTLTIKGVIFSNVENGKAQMRSAFSTFASGRLIFDGKYYIYVYVKESPTISPIKGNGNFVMQLFAPMPCFQLLTETVVPIGGITPMFMFPINYATPHLFGVKSRARYANVVNSGDVRIPYRVDFVTELHSTNMTLTNMRTLKHIKINGGIEAGQKISIYRDDTGILRVEFIEKDIITDIFPWLDESSDLFELAVGDNILLADDDEDGEYLTVNVSYNPAIGAVYET